MVKSRPFLLPEIRSRCTHVANENKNCKITATLANHSGVKILESLGIGEDY